jgi:hypothetical protein
MYTIIFYDGHGKEHELLTASRETALLTKLALIEHDTFSLSQVIDFEGSEIKSQMEK